MSCYFVQENPSQLGRVGMEAWSGLGGGCEAKAGWGDWGGMVGRMVGRHGGGMPGRGRGSRIQAPPNDRPPTIQKLWPGLMTLPTKQWSLTRLWRFPTNHPPIQQTTTFVGPTFHHLQVPVRPTRPSWQRNETSSPLDPSPAWGYWCFGCSSFVWR